MPTALRSIRLPRPMLIALAPLILVTLLAGCTLVPAASTTHVATGATPTTPAPTCVPASPPAASSRISEYPTPQDHGDYGGGKGITRGPDGALWFTEADIPGNASHIGRITTAGQITEFPLRQEVFLRGIARGSDGALWFTEIGTIGRITTAGQITEYPLATAQSRPGSITLGPDGALWFTQDATIGRITTTGQISEYALPNGSYAGSIARGPDDALWFTGGESDTREIGRMATNGSVTEFPLHTSDSNLPGITLGPDGNLWFTAWEIRSCGLVGTIGRITTSGQISTYNLAGYCTPVGGCPFRITTGPDGALWFTENGKIGRIVP